MNNREQDADAIMSEAEQRLAEVEPGPFSIQAFDLLKLKVSEHVRSLITESAKISRRRRADVISATNVEEASDYLVNSSSHRWIRHTGTIGGILLGASLSNFLSMTTTEQYSTTGVLISAGLSIIGAFAVAFHIGRS